jgi:AcrR family transcriptional regulator
MAYRKTEQVLAQLAAKREAIISAAVVLVKTGGMEAVKSDAVAGQAGIAEGGLYKHFPDMEELRAVVVARFLELDVKAMRERAAEGKTPLQALASAIAVFYGRRTFKRRNRALTDSPAYREGIRKELELLMAAAGYGDAFTAAAALGAIYAVFDVPAAEQADRARAATLFVLRGMGVVDVTARKVVHIAYGTGLALA